MVCIQVCCQRPRNVGLGMLDLESHGLAERLTYVGHPFEGHGVGTKSEVFLRLESDSKAEGHRKPNGAAPLTH